MRRSFVIQNDLSFGSFLMGEDAFFSITAYNSSDKIYSTDYIGYNWVYRPSSVSNTLQKNAEVDIFPSLEAILMRNCNCKHIESEVFEYFFIKYIIGSLTLIAECKGRDTLDEYCNAYFEWLDAKFPAYSKNRFLSPFRPKEEAIGIRTTIWLLAKLPMRFRKFLLHNYNRVKKHSKIAKK